MIDWLIVTVQHAANMAVLYRNQANLEGCSIYLTLYPDNDCAKSIIQAKMKIVVYWKDKPCVDNATRAAQSMIRWSGISVRFAPTRLLFWTHFKNWEMTCSGVATTICGPTYGPPWGWASYVAAPTMVTGYRFLLVWNSNFVFKTRRFSDIRLQKWRDLEIRVRGHSRSLKVVPCYRLGVVSY